MNIPKEGEEENELSTRGSCSGTLRFCYQLVEIGGYQYEKLIEQSQAEFTKNALNKTGMW